MIPSPVDRSFLDFIRAHTRLTTLFLVYSPYTDLHYIRLMLP